MDDIEQKVVDAITKMAEDNHDLRQSLKTRAKRKAAAVTATNDNFGQLGWLAIFVLQLMNPLFFIGGMFITICIAFTDAIRFYINERHKEEEEGGSKKDPTCLGLFVGFASFVQVVMMLYWFVNLAAIAYYCPDSGPLCWQRIGMNRFW